MVSCRGSDEPAMEKDETRDEKGFVVQDRRRFTAVGDAKPGVEGNEPETRSAEVPSAHALTFSGFVVGLAQQAFVSLGLVSEVEGEAPKKDLPQAKAMIDVLTMLRDKTRGNLDEVESRMMDDVLDELRLRFVRELRDSRKTQGERS
jgi:hypothetical protein